MYQNIRDPNARVRALCEYGCKVEVDFSVPPRRYFRSGVEMYRMANVYFDEGDLESAFILYSKYITLFVEKLPKHPTYNTASSSDLAVIRKRIKTLFALAEEIKNKLRERYKLEEDQRREEEKTREDELASQRKKEEERQERRRLEEANLRADEIKKRRENEERMLAEQEREFRRLQEEERNRISSGAAVAGATAGVGGLALVDKPFGGVPVLPSPDGGIPNVPPPSYGEAFPVVGNQAILGPGVSAVQPPPSILKPNVPSRELKPSATASLPSVDRSTKPDHFMSIGGLRDIYVPAELPLKFLNIANANTGRNVETCALLCGKLAKGVFRITHLLVPKQSGTSDNCNMEGEEDIFAYQDKHDLMTFGWIHTHPSQTAFLSSVDLHTHYPYQKMLPESIAIVCSPKYQETGYFCITHDHGMNVLENCKQRGFHEHPRSPPMFETCNHCKIDAGATVIVADLR